MERNVWSLHKRVGLFLLLTLLGWSLTACAGSQSASTSTSVDAQSAKTPVATVNTLQLQPNPFQIVNVALSASPSIDGHACGSQLTVTFTTTFYILDHGSGGALTFNYSTDNGTTNSDEINLVIAPNQTNLTYTFTWSGKLSTDQSAPIGLIDVDAPNEVESQPTIPTGHCS